MKLATYLHEGRLSFGVVTDGGICDVPSAWPDAPVSLLEALRRGPQALRRISQLASVAPSLIDPEAVELLAPIPAPPKLIALAGNYVKHIRESKLDKGLTPRPHEDTVPRPFLMPASAVIGPDAEIPWPPFSRQIDHEVELAVVIGRPAKCVPPEQAAEHIAGYTIANDVSARTVTFADGRAPRPWDEFYDWMCGKWADGFCPMGPYLVTADEVGDPRDLELELRVNGELRQQAGTAEMIFDVYEVVSFLSHLMTLTPGDVIATGTPHGVGMATDRYLQPGDVITCRIEKIGELTNTLGQRPSRFYSPCRNL